MYFIIEEVCVLFRQGSKNRILSFAGLILFAVGVLAAILMFLLRYDELWVWYDLTREKLSATEQYILNIPQRGKFILMIFLLFAIKCFIPIYPTSTVCFLTGLVLPIYLAIPVNILGFCIMLTCKYFWGFRFGGGTAWKMINKVDGARKLIQQDGKGNPWLLVMLRLVPGVPVNSVSSIYGSMNFGFFKYLLLSLLGFMPRLISYSLVGRNAYDPLSIGFLLPLMIICLFSGITLLSVNGVMILIKRIVEKTRKNKASEVVDNENVTQ